MKAKRIAVECLGEVQFAALGAGRAADVVAAVLAVVVAAFGVGSVGIARAVDASQAPRRPDF